MDYFNCLLAVVVGWQLHGLYHAYKVHVLVNKLIAEHDLAVTNLDDSTDKNENVVLLAMEEHSDVKIVFDSTTGEFICQGSTMEELAANFYKRQSGKIGVLAVDTHSLYFIDGKVCDKYV